MSYSITVPSTPKANVAGALATAVESWADPTEEQSRHFEAAIKATALVAATVGAEDGELTVTLAGHTNPDHQPTEGYADEYMTIAIAVARPL